jgi:hypothetical protein
VRPPLVARFSGTSTVAHRTGSSSPATRHGVGDGADWAKPTFTAQAPMAAIVVIQPA